MACRCCWGFFVAKVRKPTSLITPAVFFLFAWGVLQHFRIKIQNSECIIVVSSDDVTPKGGRTEYVENCIPPSRKPIQLFLLVLLSPPVLKLRSLGEHKSPFQTFIRVLEGYLNDLPTDDPVLPGTYTHQLPRCDRLPGEKMGYAKSIKFF